MHPILGKVYLNAVYRLDVFGFVFSVIACKMASTSICGVSSILFLLI
jgi:hypothetical protein